MNGWIIAIALLIVTAAGLLFVGRLPRATRELVAAALVLGLAGYAWQGSPAQPGDPRASVAQKDSFDEDIASMRKEMGERFSEAGQWLVISDALGRQGKSEEAANVIRAGLRQYPDDSNLWLGLGNALMVHSNGVLSPAADFAFRKALNLAPDAPAPAYFYGLALAQAGDLARANTIWTRLYATAPKDAEWRRDLEVNLGMVRQGLGEPPLNAAPPADAASSGAASSQGDTPPSSAPVQP